jgi:hypothetical protein
MKLLTPLLFSLLASSNVAAQTSDSNKNHTIFLGAGFSGIEADSKSESNSLDEIDFSSQIGYRYQYNGNFAFDARFIESQSSEFENIRERKQSFAEFSSIIISAQARTAISKNNFLYANLGLNNYRWELVAQEQANDLDSSGISTFAALGWKYQFSRIELGLEYQWLDMSKLTSKSFAFNLGYRF